MLKSALLLCRVLLVICLIILSVLTIALVYWHIEPTAFSRVDMTNSFQAGFGMRAFRVYTARQVPPSDSMMLSELTVWMVYWLYLRGVFFLFILFLILRRVIRVLRSIRSLQSFYQENIVHFRVMARYGLIAFAVSCLNFVSWQSNFTFSISFAWGPLAFALACLVLAEVFKEGQELAEEQKLIV